MNLSAWSIRNPIPAAMLFVLLTLGGLMGFRAMKVQNFPDMDLPIVIVRAALPGAAPGQLEADVARKIENAIATTQGLKHITTTLVDGVASIAAEFQLEKPVQEAVDDVRSAVARVRADLPADLRDPIITKFEFTSQPIAAFAIASSRMDDEALSWFIDDTLTRRLLAVPGVGGVARVGGVTREVQVRLDPLKLQALGASVADVSRQLRQVQLESAGGRAEIAGGEQALRTLATVQTAAELAALDIALPGGRRVRLDQLASVRDAVAEPRSAALLDGKAVIGFEVTRSRGASEIEVGAGVQKVLDALRAAHPDLTLTRTVDFVQIAQDEYDSSMKLLYEGAFLAVVVVWLFLRDWRATIVSAVALPLSVIPAFIGMQLLGFSINIITLLALSLVVGILVDDAIVEVENIVRHLRMGKSPYQAAMEAADEIGLAVIATTFTLIAVFLPTAFMSGIAGRFFKQFGWTAALAVFASLVVARLLTPMMAAYILKPLVGQEREPRWLAAYMRASAWCLRHRVLTLLGALVFFVGSIALIPLLPSGFIPADDNAQTQVTLELPPGTRLQETRALALRAAERAAAVGHIESIYTAIGAGAAGADPGHQQRRLGRPAHRHPHPAHGAARRAPAQAGHRAAAAQRHAGAARRARQGGPGRLQRQVHPGAGQRGPAGAGHQRARGGARAAHHSRHRRHQLQRQPGAPGDRRAPGLRPRRRPGGHLAGHRRDAARGHRRRLRAIPAQAEPGTAPGAHRGAPAGRRARRPAGAAAPDGAGRPAARCALAKWPAWSWPAGRPSSTATTARAT